MITLDNYAKGKANHKHDLVPLLNHWNEPEALRAERWTSELLADIASASPRPRAAVHQIRELLSQAFVIWDERSACGSTVRPCACDTHLAIEWFKQMLERDENDTTLDGKVVPMSRVVRRKTARAIGVKDNQDVYSRLRASHWDDLYEAFKLARDAWFQDAHIDFDSHLARQLGIVRTVSPSPIEFALAVLALLEHTRPPKDYVLFDTEGFIIRGFRRNKIPVSLHHSVVRGTTLFLDAVESIKVRAAERSSVLTDLNSRDDAIELTIEGGELIVSRPTIRDTERLTLDPKIADYVNRLVEVRAECHRKKPTDNGSTRRVNAAPIGDLLVIVVEDDDRSRQELVTKLHQGGLRVEGFPSVEPAVEFRSRVGGRRVIWILDQGGVVRYGGYIKALDIYATPCKDDTSPAELLPIIKRIRQVYPRDQIVDWTRLFQGPSLLLADELGNAHACKRESSDDILLAQLTQDSLRTARPNYWTPLPNAVVRFLERVNPQSPEPEPRYFKAA